MNPMNFFNRGSINPIQMMLSGENNPKDFAVNMLRQKMGDNPMVNNAIQMIDGGDTQGIEQLVRNLCKTQNINVDDVLRATQNMFGVRR